MRVEVWVRATLVKSPEDSAEDHYLRMAQWDDPDSRHPREAAARVWRVCSSGATDLSSVEREWAKIWKRNRNGYGFSVGDVVVADGVAMRCEAQGFSPCDAPN